MSNTNAAPGTKSLSELFGVDKKKATEGQWITVGDTDFKIAFANRINPKWAAVADRVYKPHRRQAQIGALSPQKIDEINHEIFAEAILLDWRMTDTTVSVIRVGDEELEFSKENAKRLFAEMPMLFQLLNDESENAANFRNVARETEAKN